ncbi:CatA-like O-acetyltransferase [Oceanobacillus profundus]|uniref:CatA-like O-acetyltransferase n=1 Tax=Oceanobacillus profundus TaxID=372463 RepID=UPI000BA67C86|nr:CatA-like O-acetyltransferase [Oceanobacillus profundus]MBR3121286.1 chloramphenicol acetyltransferase [Oceanobacillus sp.]MCM3397550.1 CatA-like O-acetyltransferase [Oceanobacillus profundus]PAE28843.1 chloramphenicol acetyltransferase [Paenibacillus sp. 7884-2]
MTNYQVIDLESFPRRNYYEYFMGIDTTFEMTVKIDVTRAVKKCKDESISFYAYSIFNLTKSVNKIPNMRYAHIDKQLVEWQELVPTFTNFNQETELFYSLWLEGLTDYKSVDRDYKKLIKDYANTTDIAPMGNVPQNVVNISSIPWMHFEHFSSHPGAIKNNLTPMITIGKYEKVGSQLLMPVNIKVHHATVDGYHVTIFFEILQLEMNR